MKKVEHTDLIPQRRSDELGDQIIIMLLNRTDELRMSNENILHLIDALKLSDEAQSALIEKLTNDKFDRPELFVVIATYKKSAITALTAMLASAIWASMSGKLSALAKEFSKFWSGL